MTFSRENVSTPPDGFTATSCIVVKPRLHARRWRMLVPSSATRLSRTLVVGVTPARQSTPWLLSWTGRWIQLRTVRGPRALSVDEQQRCNYYI